MSLAVIVFQSIVKNSVTFYNGQSIVVISPYVDASRKFALIGNFSDTVDRGRKRAYVACVLIKLVPVNRQLVVEVEHARLSATVGN